MEGNENDGVRGKRGPPSVNSIDDSDNDPLANRGLDKDQIDDQAVAKAAVDTLRKTPTSKLGDAAKSAAKGSASKLQKKHNT